MNLSIYFMCKIFFLKRVWVLQTCVKNIFSDLLWYIFWNIPKYFQVFQNICKYFQIFSHIFSYIHIFSSISKYSLRIYSLCILNESSRLLVILIFFLPDSPEFHGNHEISGYLNATPRVVSSQAFGNRNLRMGHTPASQYANGARIL